MQMSDPFLLQGDQWPWIHNLLLYFAKGIPVTLGDKILALWPKKEFQSHARIH